MTCYLCVYEGYSYIGKKMSVVRGKYLSHDVNTMRGVMERDTLHMSMRRKKTRRRFTV